MALHFKQFLNPDFISQVGSTYGFSQASFIEKYIIDFEILHAISQNIPYTLKGGMAMPFHLRDDGVRRLSEDVDIFTNADLKTIDAAIGKTQQEYRELTFEIYEPPNPRRKLPLRVYDVYYDSCLDSKKQRISLEILFGGEGDLKVEVMSPPTTIFGFPVDFDIRLLSCSALFGDKLTTLAYGSIGLLPDKRSNAPKQVYDIARLLRTSAEGLKENVDSFKSAVELQCKIQDVRHSTEDILKDVIASIDSMLTITNSIGLAGSTKDHFKSFLGQLLNGNSQTVTDHISDLLSIRLYVARMLESIQRPIPVDIMAKTLSIINASESQIAAGNPVETKKGLLTTLANTPKLQKAVRGLALRPLALICEIQQCEHRFNP